MNKVRSLTATIFLLLGFLANAEAQPYPPAQGPDAPGAGASSLPVAVITGMVKNRVEEVLANTNAELAARTDFRARLSYSFTEFNPRISSTQYSDRPNERYVHVPYIFTYTIYDIEKHTALGWVNYPWTRKVSQSIAVNVSCNRWHTQFGEMKATPDINPPYLEAGHSISEQAVWAWMNGWLIEYIDGKIRAQLRNINVGGGSTELGLRCNLLGVATVSQGFPFNSIEYKATSGIGTRLPFADNISVKLLKIKRLRARGTNGILYDEVENIEVDYFVNQQYAQAGSFTMREDNEVDLSLSPISMRRPGNNQNLILIFNVRQNNSSYTVDSNYNLFTNAQNFGHGVRTAVVYKTYWMPPTPPLKKPMKVSVPAYEITYEVNAPQIVISR